MPILALNFFSRIPPINIENGKPTKILLFIKLKKLIDKTIHTHQTL